MPKRLKLALKTRASILSPLILKSAIFSCLLMLAGFKGGIFWPFVFLVAASFLYFKGFFQWRNFLYSFLALLIYSSIIINFLVSPSYVVAGSIIFGFLFLLLLGVKDLIFINRQAVFNFFSGALYFFIAVAFFIADKHSGWGMLGYYLLSFTAFYFILKESLNALAPDFSKNKKNLISAGVALLALESMSVISFLPLGFLNSAAIIILFIFILEDLIFYHIKGGLSRQVVLNNAAILVVALIFIFATSRWKI